MKSNNQGNQNFRKRTNPNPAVRVFDVTKKTDKEPGKFVEISCGLCQHRFERPTKPASLVLVCPACGVRFENRLLTPSDSQHRPPRTLEEKLLAPPSQITVAGQGVERTWKKTADTTAVQPAEKVDIEEIPVRSEFSEPAKFSEHKISRNIDHLQESAAEDLVISFRQKKVAANGESRKSSRSQLAQPQKASAAEHVHENAIDQLLRPEKSKERSLWNKFSQSTFGAIVITLLQSLLIVAVLLGLINGTSFLFLEDGSSQFQAGGGRPEAGGGAAAPLVNTDLNDFAKLDNIDNVDNIDNIDNISNVDNVDNVDKFANTADLPTLQPPASSLQPKEALELPLFNVAKDLPLFVSQKDLSCFSQHDSKCAKLPISQIKEQNVCNHSKREKHNEIIDFDDFNNFSDLSVDQGKTAIPFLANGSDNISDLQLQLKQKLDESEKKVKELEQQYEKSLLQKDQIQLQSKRLVSETLLRESAIALEKNPPRSLILSLKSIRILYELGEQISDLGKLVLAQAYAVQSPGTPFVNQIPLVLAHSVSSNGKWLLTANTDKSLWIWDLSKIGGQKSSEVGFHIDTTPVPLVQLLLTPDEHWVVGARSDGIVEMWDMSKDRPNEATLLLKEHIPGLSRVEITPNGKWLIAYGNGKNQEMNSQISSAVAERSVAERSVAERSVAERSVAERSVERSKNPSDEPNGVWIWNLEILKPNGQGFAVPSAIVLRGDNQPVQCLAISPNSRWLATGNADRNIRVYDLLSTSPGANQKILRGHQLDITTIQFSENGRWIATGSRDNTVRIWDLSEHVPNPKSYVLNAHNGWISSLALSNNGQWLSTAGYDQTVRIWDMRSIIEKQDKKPLLSLLPKQGVVRKVQFNPDSSMLITHGTNKSVKIWNMKLSAESTIDRPIQLSEQIASYSFGEEGRWLVLARNYGNQTTVSLWPMRTDDLFRQASHFVETALPVEVHRQEEIYANQFESRLVR